MDRAVVWAPGLRAQEELPYPICRQDHSSETHLRTDAACL